MLGLPDGVTACLFDLDGVLTDTASVHTTAWKETFDAYLQERVERGDDDEFHEFTEAEYFDHVDGKPRYDGVRDFLASRDIELEEGEGDDTEPETVRGIGNRKNQRVLELMETDGVEVFEGSRRYLEACVEAGLRRAVVSSSANTAQVLDVTGLGEHVELRVDGVTIKEEGLDGKPAPDTFLLAAERLGVEPSQAAVFEDAVSGVKAGRAGDFGLVVGVDRHDQGDALREGGADVVVRDLEELL